MIRDQAINFWTNKSFDVCCQDESCHYSSGQQEDKSYLIQSDKHGFEILIHQTPDTELAISVMQELLEDKQTEFPAHWDLTVDGTVVEKSKNLTPQQIAFWDEVAVLYQTIPEWLVKPLDEAFEAQSVMEEDYDYFMGDLDEEEAEDRWFVMAENDEDQLFGELVLALENDLVANLKQIVQEELGNELSYYSFNFDTETGDPSNLMGVGLVAGEGVKVTLSDDDQYHLRFGMDPGLQEGYSVYQWNGCGKPMKKLCECSTQVLMSNGCQCGGC